ncbi:hypothetical protein MCOR31_009414 [Pyricularia oryzae]|nr:hypothetical protein MCOR31_009414 [Pyricularia oryzae]KAI6394356.1 hypothetical protein MCOR24_009548 [Pyricularia oryzae]KAI6436869.1 hypothetical protein MCOR21_000852 [Pyricularia oryzae]KAI6594365.1 hypothetical protein MCOR12_006913 [Pyricularia oryzae]
MELLRFILVLNAVAVLALPHVENRRNNDHNETLPSDISLTIPSAFDSTNISSTWITADHAPQTIGCFPRSTSSYKTAPLSVTTLLVEYKQKEVQDIFNSYRLASTSSTKYSFCQAEVVTSYQTFSEGVPTPRTVAVAITQCTQTAKTSSVTSSPSRTPPSSTSLACLAYITLTDMVRSCTATSSATLTSTMTSCGLTKPTETMQTSYTPKTMPVTIDNSVCFVSTVTSTSLFTAGSDITITMFTAHKPTTTCRPIGWETQSSRMAYNTVAKNHVGPCHSSGRRQMT